MNGKALSTVCLTFCMLSGSLTAGEHERKSISFPPDEVDMLVINADLGVGEFEIRPAEIDELIKAEIEYDPRKIKIQVDYEKDGQTGFIELADDLRRHRDIDSEDNHWSISLSKNYKTELTLDLGACEADIELGGIPLEILALDIGAAAGKLSFDEANPITADRLDIDAGAAKFEIKGLGNANFRRFYFDGGVGKFILDFSGNYKRKSKAKISIGLGKVEIYIPSDLPVRIDAESNFLSSVDFENADRSELDGDYYESKNYNESDYGLDLEIEVGLGSVDIEWMD